MTPAEATSLAVRILNTFNGPPTDIWETDLAPLDAGRANTTFARLRREHSHRWLSIAEFMNMYRAIHTEPPTTEQVCGWCNGAAVTNAGFHQANGHPYTGVTPCEHCPPGRRIASSSVFTFQPARHFVSDTEAERLRRNPT